MPQVKVNTDNTERADFMPNDVLLAIGGNLTSSVGPPVKTIRAAVKALEAKGATIRAISSFYSTTAFPEGSGPDFVNAAARISVDWTPQRALEILHQIESSMDRVRAQRWGQRTLDLDLIACGDLVLPDARTHARWRDLTLAQQMQETPDELILPHPRLQDRPFVLVPLADVAPNWVHPLLGQSVLQMRDALEPASLEEIRPLE